MADMKFSVSARREGPALVRVQARNFSMYVDEPANLGGSDKGANPVEYLLGALAGCLNVVANLVANEMNIELRGMTIEAEGDLNPGRFSGKSMEERAGIQANTRHAEPGFAGRRSHEAKMARNDRTAVSIKRQPDQSDAGEDHARVIGAPSRARSKRAADSWLALAIYHCRGPLSV